MSADPAPSRPGVLGSPAWADDPHDGRRPAIGDGLVRQLGDATVLASADVRTATVLAELVGERDRDVVLAVALAVRAVRLGHVFVDLATAASTVAPEDEEVDLDLGSLPWPDPAAWTASVAASALVASGPDGPADRPVRLIGSRVYLDRYWRHERAIATDLLARVTADPPSVDADLLADGLDRLFPRPPAGASTPAGEPGHQPGEPGEPGEPGDPDGPGEPGTADELQRIAAATAVLRRFAVVAGGPGTGKTTTVARIAALLHEQARAAGDAPPRIALLAPTGKAATRLAEAVHAEAVELDTDPDIRAALVRTGASTIHRQLGWQPGNRSRFRHDRTNPLPHNVVIVDESSMVSLSLMARLLESVRPTARLVLVGDPRQLASVEAGAVLGDIVGPASDGLHLRPLARTELAAVTGATVDAVDPGPGVAVGDGIVVLQRVHRFGGGIASVADAIDAGDADAVIDELRSHPADVSWVETDPDLPVLPLELERIREAVLTAATSVVGAARGGDGVAALDALRSVQVLCAHRRGAWGASWWRFEIERWLRAEIPGYATSPWYAGRPLLVTENDYALGVFNGDTGVVVDDGHGHLRAVFDRKGEVLSVRPTRLAAVDSLYAITIHKAQGSQFDQVVVVLPEPTSPILTRELLYTGVTRARSQLTVVGSDAAVRAAVERPVARASGLAEALWAPHPGTS